MQPIRILQILWLLMLANGTPLFAARLMGSRWSYPVDGNIQLVDGKRLLGPSKTVRGVVLAILVTAAGSALLGLDSRLGALVGSLAMVGDLFSSFVKCRLRMPPSSNVPGLDQIPEALLPVLACWAWLSLSFLDIILTVALFFVGEIVFSRLFFALGLRDRPY
ncbi:MAG: CDP-archaeol synthase [Alphaproteobacteria bacterium]|nr:CDP-archaeol synthase [Alphaproteobacteria bacterium]